MGNAIGIEAIMLDVFDDANYGEPWRARNLAQSEPPADRVQLWPVSSCCCLIDNCDLHRANLIAFAEKPALYQRSLDDTEIIRANANDLCSKLLRLGRQVFDNQVPGIFRRSARQV